MLKFGNDKFYFEVLGNERQNSLVPIRIRINNEVLGTFHSATYMPSFLGGLHILITDKYYFTNESEQSFVVTRNDFLTAYNSLIDWTQSFLHSNYNFKI